MNSTIKKKRIAIVTIFFNLSFTILFFINLIACSGSSKSDSRMLGCHVCTKKVNGSFPLVKRGKPANLLISTDEFSGVERVMGYFKNDMRMVSGSEPNLYIGEPPLSKTIIVAGTLGHSALIDQLINNKKIDLSVLQEKNEMFNIQVVEQPFEGVEQALVIAGSDKRGTIYGIFEVSEQMGISPWYWWADVPVEQYTNLYFKKGIVTEGEPKVKYRGIFLNDEEPALGRWAVANYGGFTSKFYEKLFELMLRLKANFLWPAMWWASFNSDDPMNPKLANELGIVMGTSHHEPMNRAHAEWKPFGGKEWNYVTNPEQLRAFWSEGIRLSKDFETLITLGMRGDGDVAMTKETNVALLQRIVNDQREIIARVTGKEITKVPQVWALYKEVQDYYDEGMRVPDDVTLLLCDDNWGNVRKLPDLNAKPHKGGFGMYYHFDYVGGPRNYKWINVSQVQRIWEQMNLAYSHGVDRIWIVNVGDLKPMEYPISFFMDMAWNPDQFNAQNLLQHTEKWCAAQFGEKYAKESARIINLYTKYNRRITPELLNDTIYSLHNYNEFERVTNDYRTLALDASRLYLQIPTPAKDAFDQLILYPVEACANLYEMYFAVAKNKDLAMQNNQEANSWADKVVTCYERDSMLTLHYNTEIAGGKWNHMMDQIHIGYTYWQQPDKRVMPKVTRVENGETRKIKEESPDDTNQKAYISVEAEHFSRKHETGGIHWEVIPYIGKTLSGVTTFPQNAYPKASDTVYLEYDMNFEITGEFPVYVLVSPTLNFNGNKGLRYAISFDGGEEQIVNINKKYDIKLMEKWQANNINETITWHKIETTGQHILRFRILEPGIVLQKIMVDLGGLKKSYLGAPEFIGK